MSFECWNLAENLRPVWDKIISGCEPAVKQSGYWMLTCPCHAGGAERTPSLEIKADAEGEKILLKCQTGCDTKDVLAALGMEWWELFVRRESGHEKEKIPTLETLAAKKKLPVDFLRTLGCKDISNGVLIPYPDETGVETTFRIRTAIDGGPKYVSKKGGKVAVYGADKLPAERDGKSLVLVEGETDCWTMWFHGFTALGISSSTHTKTLLKRHVEGFDSVYVVREPDAAGDEFVNGAVSRLYDHGFAGTVIVVSFGRTKDPSGLHVDVGGDGERFKADIREVMATGEPIDVRAVTHEASGGEKEKGEREKKPDQTTDLFLLGKAGAEIVLDEVSGLAVARIDLDGERVDCAVRSGTFGSWLTRLYLKEKGRPVAKGCLDNAVNSLAASYDRKVKTYCRIARVGDAVYYDLCSGGRVVEITAEGWRVLNESPVHFLRGRTWPRKSSRFGAER